MQNTDKQLKMVAKLLRDATDALGGRIIWGDTGVEPQCAKAYGVLRDLAKALDNAPALDR